MFPSCILFLLSCTVPESPGDTHGPLRIHFLDVGQGDACLLRTPPGRFILCDAGNKPGLPAVLRELGVDTLESVFISHPDLDHFGSLPALLAEIPVKKVHLPAAGSDDPAWLGLMQALDERRVETDTLFSGDALMWEGGVHARVLWPPRYFSGSDNELSQVLRVEYQGRFLLLTGDIEAQGEAGILASRMDVTADVLKVAHHGSRTSSSLPFIAGVGPRWAVISCDSAVYGHPHRETLEGLKWIVGDEGRVVRTDREGTVGFEVGEQGITRMKGIRY